jgi:hypothetical protein
VLTSVAKLMCEIFENIVDCFWATTKFFKLQETYAVQLKSLVRKFELYYLKVYPTIKKLKKYLPNLKYPLKNKYPPLAKKFTKGYHSVVTHVLYHFCDMSLITACAIFCSLKFHVVCTCTNLETPFAS